MTPHARPPIAPRDPASLEEWHEAAVCAEIMLRVDAARQYGLVTGGPVIHVDRCAELLRRAAAEHDIHPTDAEVDAAWRALLRLPL
jgi:hypothetical protein